jgi:hypothetical protein
MRGAAALLLIVAGCGDDGSAADAGTDAGVDGAVDAGSDAGGPMTCEPAEWLFRSHAGQTDDGSVAFSLRFCQANACGGGCERYPIDFSLTFDGATWTAIRPQIEYTVTHHNWYDSLVATLPDRRLRWRVDTDVMTWGWRHYVSAETLAGDVLLAETEVPVPTM